MIARLLRTLKTRRLQAEINHRLSERKVIRQARQASAQLGISTRWRKAGEQCRAMFGEQA